MNTNVRIFALAIIDAGYATVYIPRTAKSQSVSMREIYAENWLSKPNVCRVQGRVELEVGRYPPLLSQIQKNLRDLMSE